MRMNSESEILDSAHHYMSDPPASLTEAGKQMILQIWEASGRPNSAPVDHYSDTVDLDALPIYHDPKSASQVREHLFSGGYLTFTDDLDETDTSVRHILSLGLADKAWDWLRESSHVA